MRDVRGMVRVALVTSMVLAAVAVGTPGAGGGGTAQALVPTADFRFVLQDRIYDGLATNVGSGVEVAIPPRGGGRLIVNVALTSGTQPSWLYFHACGVPVDRTKPAAAFAEPGETEINLAPIDVGQGCMTRFGDARFVLDLIGVQDGTPGLDYVAHDRPTTIDVTPSTVINLNVRDASVPAGAEAVAIWVGVFASDTDIQLVSLCNNQFGILQRTVPSAAGGFGDNLFIAPIDAAGNVCLTVSGDLPEAMYVRRYGYLQTGVTPSAEGLPYSGWVEQEAPGYVAQSPSRLFDTRDNGGPPLAAGQVRRYQFTGLPATATAVALNITATATTGAGYVSAYPCDAGTPPDVSNVNFTGAGQTVPNFAVVSLGTTQELCFFTLTTTHLLVDVAGYFVWEAGDGYVPATPARVFDTRPGGARLGAGATLTVDLTGRVGDATAVALNVTATQTTGDGFLTVFPCGEQVPTASNVNYRANQTRPNLVVVKVPADRRICVYSPTATHVFGDLAGWFSPSSNIGMFDEEPFRTLDTREPAGSPPLRSGEEIGFTFGYRYLRALAWNLTATQTAGPGFVTGYPCAGGLPPTSNVNYSGANETVASFSFLPLDSALELCFYALTQTHLLADEAGYFVVPVPFEVFYDGAPARIGPFTAQATARPAG